METSNSNRAPKLLDRVRTAIRMRHYSRRTEDAYARWIRAYFATHLLEFGYDIRRVQELLGHRDVRTTMTYLHVMQKGALGVKSPVDRF